MSIRKLVDIKLLRINKKRLYNKKLIGLTIFLIQKLIKCMVFIFFLNLYLKTFFDHRRVIVLFFIFNK